MKFESFDNQNEYGGSGLSFEYDVWGKTLHIPNWDYDAAVEVKKNRDYMKLNRMCADALIASGLAEGDQQKVVGELERLSSQDRTTLFIELAKLHQSWDPENPEADRKHSVAKTMTEMLDAYLVEHCEQVDISDERLRCYNLLGSPADIRNGSDGCFEIAGAYVTVDTTLNTKEKSGADVIVRGDILDQEGHPDEAHLEPYIEQIGSLLIQRLEDRMRRVERFKAA